ncbi:nucleotidyltransferase family protein [Alteromonas sp. KUL106]|uniref:nucleotidyltransferase family protein n=1 Tax=Alteromonas sp. KUL106 TaxID=2480799 RepID=UPI001357C009|nr:nucleotidyltransferase family protein [Alteromonas sp. KUL106]
MQKILTDILTGNHSDSLSTSEWRDVILVARANSLLPRVASILLRDKAKNFHIPSQVHAHFVASIRHETLFHNQVKNEVKFVNTKISEALNRKLIVLKGAGYVVADSCAAKGRIFSDIDLLVLKSDIPKVERALHLFGFVSDTQSEYDQKYYREWAHEIPPLRHFQRGTVLDVHHNIIPIVSGRAPDIDLFISSTRETEYGVEVLRPAAMFLHSAIHLFFSEEFTNGFRDLSDLSLLLDEIIDDDVELSYLFSLAGNTGFENELFLAFRYLERVFDRQIPAHIYRRFKQPLPKGIRLGLNDFIFGKVLAANHRLVDVTFRGLAQWLAFVRGHLLKMPFNILVKHTASKLWRSIVKSVTGDVENRHHVQRKDVKEQ